ncbi:MAG: redoxin family protein [Lysobacter sp.]|nr:redoxin family protein [Lysobacter sp.]
MKVNAPSPWPPVRLVDIYDQPIIVGNGRKMLLSLFREATCPLCNVRVFELTHNFKDISARGLDIVAVFSSNRQDVLRFIARQPRPFRMVSDPEGRIYEAFGVESSVWGNLKALKTRLQALRQGMGVVGLKGMMLHAMGAMGVRGQGGSLMPADFLSDERGNIVETYYGVDAGDHIPLSRIELFVARRSADHVAEARPAAFPAQAGPGQRFGVGNDRFDGLRHR